VFKTPVGFRFLFAVGLLFLLGASIGTSRAFSDDCISGKISAHLETQGKYAGLYKYTVDVTWSADKGLSHITLDLGLGQCRDVACASPWIFPNPAGEGTGEGDDDSHIKLGSAQDGKHGDVDENDGGGACTVGFKGGFNCKGDASIDNTEPVLKFDVQAGGPCGTKAGTAVLCFYTDVPPSNGHPPIVFNKNGHSVCGGTLTGPIPVICPVSTQPTAWSRIKVIFGTGE